MKKFFLILIGFTSGLLIGTAQQNRMWVPGDKQASILLAESGFRLPLHMLYDPSKPSFNDAVGQFNGGCSGGIISPRGLFITNHHCGYGAIQSHSTLEHNYVQDGFWARSLEEELPNPGMYVSFVRKIIDVTPQILEGITDETPENQRRQMIEKRIRRIKDTLGRKPWEEVEIKPYLYGNRYYALVTETFRDIRLVGAPPSSVGKFGADTDNWMWPRHSGDFSLFRIYASPDNKPADYSPDNVPYRPPVYLPVTTEGVRERDLIIVYGFPGRTRQYLPAFAVKYITEKLNPQRIAIREKALKVMENFMKTNDTLKLMYTARYARVANYWKKWQGENTGIRRSNALKHKEILEKQLLVYAKAKGLEKETTEVLDSLRTVYKKLEKPGIARAVWVETVYLNNDWLRRAILMHSLAESEPDKFKKRKDELTARIDREYAQTDNRVSKALFEAMAEAYLNRMPEEYVNPLMRNKSPQQLAAQTERTSVLASREKWNRWKNLSLQALRDSLMRDGGYALARALIKDYYETILPDYTRQTTGMNRLMRRYTALLQRTGVIPHPVPDANGTLRLSFGFVEGYRPRDGMYYKPFTTIDGVVEKYIPGDYEFDLPEEFLRLYREKDFGNYAVNGTVPVNFLGTAHTTGGNSGSPVLNARGKMVGLNFDRVWEGTMSDLFYDPQICRNIMVDMRYVMFIIDKLGHATRLTDEILSSK